MQFFFLFHETPKAYFVLIMAGPSSAQTATQSAHDNRCLIQTKARLLQGMYTLASYKARWSQV